MRFLTVCAASYLILMNLGGCKKTSTSQVKSLNNFARNEGAEVSRNVCTGTETPILGIKSEWDHVDFKMAPANTIPELKKTLKESLTAVPANLQQLFFGLGGTIVFQENLGKNSTSSNELNCQQSSSNDLFQSEGTQKIDACWTIHPKTLDFVILINPSKESIQHATVRIFGYVLSQILTKLNVDDKGVLIAQNDQAFDDLIAKISVAVEDDVKNSGGKYTLGVNSSLRRTDSFRYFAFAESFDSYYCNRELQESMKLETEFPRTFALFEKMDQELRKVSLQKSNANPNERTTGQFGLVEASGNEFNLGLFSGLFGGMTRVAAGLGRGVLHGVGTIGRGALNVGGGILSSGRSLLGGAIRGTGRLLGGAGRILGGGVIGIGRRLFGR